MRRKYVIAAATVLIVLISVSLFLILKPSARPFYVGVEFAYGSQFSQLKALVDKVKDYTNLFVIGSVTLTFNRTALDESCNYIYSSGLNFIVLITSYLKYNSTNGYPGSNSIFDWFGNATREYGDKFLGIYRFDEPGGNQLDDGKYQLIMNASLSYARITQTYVGTLSGFTHFYGTLGDRTSTPVLKIFTSDYGLYWFDYQGGYSTVFAEFVGNQSRQGIIALERGAAQSFNRNWGVIVTWKYDQAPYLESGDELFSDLSQAYSAGATYAIVFSYPDITSYGTLTTDDFQALQTFWSELHTNPGQFGSNPAEGAYVLPANFGFGFRNPDDTIWGLFPASNDSYTAKIWSDTQILLACYYDRLNIIYDYPDIIGPTLHEYSRVFYWNQTVTISS
ncbi:MAG TPA: hypothetical protein VK536_04125 [Candidatus Limnocylindrales bacterium]|nr:hypothetical protein [Candidatus Limnocylindrales bacterium]